MQQAAPPGRRRSGRPRVRPERERLAGAGGRRRGAAPRPRRGLRRHARRLPRSRGPHRRDQMPGCGPLVTMGPLKIISDGSLNTRTAWCWSPYAHGGGTGAPNITSDGLRHVMEAANRHGLEVAMHAIGDAAVGQALKEFDGDRRPRLDRARAADRSRGLASDGPPRRPRERATGPPARRPRPHRELLARPHRPLLRRCAGCRTTASSSPWAATHRSPRSTPGWRSPPRSTAARDERDPWHPEQSLTVDEALGGEHRRARHRRRRAPGRPRPARRRPAPPRLLRSSRPRASARCRSPPPGSTATGSLRARRAGASSNRTSRPGPLRLDRFKLPSVASGRPSATVSSRMLRGSSSRSPKTSRSWPIR